MGNNENNASQRAQKIAYLNDKLRSQVIYLDLKNRTWECEDGTIVLTDAVAGLPSFEIGEILFKVATFKNFDEGNDPYREHDFGSFTCNHEKNFFKIDYYDKSYHYISDDPTDPKKTNRVMTVMLREEY